MKYTYPASQYTELQNEKWFVKKRKKRKEPKATNPNQNLTATEINVLPAMYFNVRDGVEVSGKVVLIHHGGARGRPEQTYTQVSNGEKVS